MQSFRDNLNTIGLTQVTAVAGQVDVDAIVAAPAVNTSAQYLVYELNDELSATAPIYIKFSFLLNGFKGQYLWIMTQVGTTVDNATAVLGGKVTDARFAATPAQNSAYGDAAAKLNIFSKQEGFAAIMFNMGGVVTHTSNLNNVKASCMVAIERTTDVTGAYTADGYTVFMTSNPATAASVATLVSRTFHGAFDSGWVTTSRRPWGHHNTVTADGGVMLWPVMKVSYAGEIVQTKNLLTYYYGQHVAGAVFTADTLQSGAKQFAAAGYGPHAIHNEGSGIGCVVDTAARLLCLAVGFE
jgi:hypothetical protein